MAGLGCLALGARGPGHPLMRRRYSMPEIIMRKYNLAQQKVEDSSGGESGVGGIRAGLSSQEPSCSESDTVASPRADTEVYGAEQEVTSADNSIDALSAIATAGNESCFLEDQIIVSETETTATSTTTSATSATSVTSTTTPTSVTTAMQSTEPTTTADSAVADMAITDQNTLRNESANALSEVIDDESDMFMSAEYLQRIVDKQLEELYSITPPATCDKDEERSICMTPLSDTDDTSPSHDIGSVATGSSYQQSLADHLCIPRYSAMPRTASMEVHPSPCNISESEGESLVDSLDDPMSPRANTRHDSRMVRGCVMDLLPDNSAAQENKAEKGEAFFIPIEEPRGKMKQNVAELLPERLREKLARRERKRMLRKEHALRKKQKRMQRNYEQQQLRDKARYSELASQMRKAEEHKSVSQAKSLAALNPKRKRAISRDEISNLESYRIDAKGEMRIDTPRENRVAKRSDCSRKRISKSFPKKECRVNTKDIAHMQSCSSINSADAGGEPGPRRVYQKTEIQDGEKRIEILEIVECMDSSPEIVPLCMYRNHHRNNSKIPVPVYKCGSTVYNSQKHATSQYQRNAHKTNSAHTNSNVDKLIAEILIDALNNKTDEVHFLKSVQKSTKDRKSIDGLPYLKAGSYTSSRRSTLPQTRRSAHQKFLQKFEVIPEEKGSLSMESSTEEPNGRSSSTAVMSDTTTMAEQNYGEKMETLNEREIAENSTHKDESNNTVTPDTAAAPVVRQYEDVQVDMKAPNYDKESVQATASQDSIANATSISEKTITPKITHNIHQQHKSTMPAGTQTDDSDFCKDNNKSKEVIQDANNVPIVSKNNKYVQTVNVQSCSSQTSPNLVSNEDIRLKSESSIQQDTNLPIATNLADANLPISKSIVDTDNKPAQKTPKSNIEKKKEVNNLSTTTTSAGKDINKTQGKEKSDIKLALKKPATIKNTTIKDTPKMTNNNRTSSRGTKTTTTTKKTVLDQQVPSIRTRKHITELTTEMKQQMTCDCSGCAGACSSDDDYSCSRSRATASCSCCSKNIRGPTTDCILCDSGCTRESDHHGHTPFNETTSYHKTISVLSVPTVDNNRRKLRKPRLTPTTASPVLTPSESEMSEANQYSEWLSMINGNADADSNANDSSIGATAADSATPRPTANVSQIKCAKEELHGDEKKRTTKLTRRKSVQRCPTLDAETTTQHEIRYTKNRQLQLVRPQSASPPPAPASSKRVQLPNPFVRNGRSRDLGTPESKTYNHERRKETQHSTNSGGNSGMWSVTLAGNYCPEMPPDVEMRLRFPKHAKSEESGTDTADNGSRPCTRCREDSSAREDSRRQTATAAGQGRDRSPYKNTAGASSRYEQRSSNVLPGVNEKNMNENKFSKGRKIVKRIECITAVSSTPRENIPLNRPRNYTSDVRNTGNYFDRESCHHITTKHGGPLSRRASLCSLQPCLSVMGSAIAPEQKPRAPTMSERDLTRAQTTYFSRTRSYLD